MRSQASSSGQGLAVSSSDEQVVGKEDVQEALVGLQLQMACVVRLVENEGDFADLIVCYTRAIADAPFKKDDLFSFHAESRSTRLPKVGLMHCIYTDTLSLHYIISLNIAYVKCNGYIATPDQTTEDKENQVCVQN